jgi:hypothetical protein
MTRSTVAIFLLTVLLLSVGCSRDGVVPCNGPAESLQSRIVRISYGTSFGWCVGYCRAEINAANNQVQYAMDGWSTVKPVVCSKEITCEEWASVTGNINVATFFSLPETIGCPDCADGGAEWIEIETSASTHRVTFEYGVEPQELSPYVDELRDLMLSFKDCN